MATSLEEAFREFCAFGTRDGTPLMDGAKFAKMCRDMNLLDKRLTTTDVDIIFAKAKPKSERKITLEQFEVAIDMLAEKKFPGDPRAAERVRGELTSGHGPATHGTTRVAANDIVDRMTDYTKYTGTHKHRFGDDGKGRGLEGRDSVPKGSGNCPQLISEQAAYVSGCKIGEASPKAKGKMGAGSASSSPKTHPKNSSPKTGGVYDRLTDSGQYTGTHKQRFDATGHGRGLQGRDTPVKGSGMSPGSVSGLASYVTGYKHENTYGKK